MNKHHILWALLVLAFHNIGKVQQQNLYKSIPIMSQDLSYFSEYDRLKMKKKVKEMFYFGYESYMKYAFPLDELNPVYCTGRGPDVENRYVFLRNTLCIILFLFPID